MNRGQSHHIQKLAVACAIQAAILTAQQDGIHDIADELEAILADLLQPEVSMAA
jgi:hypothetical protein